MSSHVDGYKGSKTMLRAGASAALLMQLAASAAAQHIQRDPASCSAVVEYPRKDIITSDGSARISPRVLAYFALGYDSVSSGQRRSQGYVLIVRGQPHWYEPSGVIRSGGQAQGSQRRVHVWETAKRQLTIVFDPTAGTVELLGERVALDTANVIFVDRVDGVGGPIIVRGSACVKRLHVNTIAKDLMDGLPAVARYVSDSGGS
jgi:hypothetical protein